MLKHTLNMLTSNNSLHTNRQSSEYIRCFVCFKRFCFDMLAAICSSRQCRIAYSQPFSAPELRFRQTILYPTHNCRRYAALLLFRSSPNGCTALISICTLASNCFATTKSRQFRPRFHTIVFEVHSPF